MADIIDQLELTERQATAFAHDPLGLDEAHGTARRMIADHLRAALAARRPVGPGDRVITKNTTDPPGTVRAVSPCRRFAWVEWSDIGYSTDPIHTMTRIEVA